MRVLWAALMVLPACGSSAATHDGGAADGRTGDAGASVDSSGPDAGTCPDFEPITIGDVGCPDMRLAYSWPSAECGARPDSPCSRCVGQGPTIALDGWDPCAAAEAAADGHATYEWSGEVAVDADCEGASITNVATGEHGTIVWGGSAAIADAVANYGPVQRVSAHGWSRPTGCVTSTRVVTERSAAVFATFPPAGGTLPITSSSRLTLGAGAGEPRCAAGPEGWCATLEYTNYSDVETTTSAALPVCGTAGLPAPLGGCGDTLDLPVTSGEIACGGRVQVGFVWPESMVLCH